MLVSGARPIFAVRFPRANRHDVDGNGGALAGRDVEPVRAGHGRPVEQRVEDEVRGGGRRLLEPVLDEVGELLAARLDRVDRETARRQSVDVVASDRAEVARAEEHHDFVVVVRALQRIVDAEPGVADVARDLARELVLAEVEELGRVGERMHAVRVDHVHLDAALEVETGVEELDLKGKLLVAPQRAIGLEADVAPLVVGHLAGAHPLGHGLLAIAVGLLGDPLGDCGDVVEPERVCAWGRREQQERVEPQECGSEM